MFGFLAPSEFAKDVARSLLSDLMLDTGSAAWDTEGDHVWIHRDSGVSLWVANKDYGLGVSVGGNRRAEPNYGDLPKRDRHHIWRAAHQVWKAREGLRRWQAAAAFRAAERSAS